MYYTKSVVGLIYTLWKLNLVLPLPVKEEENQSDSLLSPLLFTGTGLKDSGFCNPGNNFSEYFPSPLSHEVFDDKELDKYVISNLVKTDLSRIKQFNFFQIPKCAGSSLTIDIQTISKQCNVQLCNLPPKPETRLRKRHCLNTNSAIITGHQGYEERPIVPLVDGGKSRVYFTMFRHPLGRVSSLYYYLTKSKVSEIPLTMTEFIKKHPAANNHMTMMLCGPFLMSSSHICRKNETYALTQAKIHLQRDFAIVGIQECYHESTELISNLLPWVKEYGGFNNLRKNVGKVNSHRQLTAEEADVITHHNLLDIELYSLGLLIFKGSQRVSVWKAPINTAMKCHL